MKIFAGPDDLEKGDSMTEKEEVGASSILGFSTSELASLSSDDLTDNPTAIKMLLHYYRQLVDENAALKNEKNTLNTYVDAYSAYKSNAATGGILLGISNISIGFGVNLLTGGHNIGDWPGISSLIIGISMIIAGIYFTFYKDRR